MRGWETQWVQPTKRIQIASTEPNHPHLHQDVAIAPFRVWNRFDERVAWVLEYECLTFKPWSLRRGELLTVDFEEEQTFSKNELACTLIDRVNVVKKRDSSD